ncbi:hypothetical protein BJ741DRAFT_650787 [Chytriomyces cf. hyalinus JEL632]|nr:hypothetical protein BJ741DRAFT_650787 [Chytriomyces cf. hyalinus JEL632]
MSGVQSKPLLPANQRFTKRGHRVYTDAASHSSTLVFMSALDPRMQTLQPVAVIVCHTKREARIDLKKKKDSSVSDGSPFFFLKVGNAHIICFRELHWVHAMSCGIAIIIHGITTAQAHPQQTLDTFAEKVFVRYHVATAAESATHAALAPLSASAKAVVQPHQLNVGGDLSVSLPAGGWCLQRVRDSLALVFTLGYMARHG